MKTYIFILRATDQIPDMNTSKECREKEVELIGDEPHLSSELCMENKENYPDFPLSFTPVIDMFSKRYIDALLKLLIMISQILYFLAI